VDAARGAAFERQIVVGRRHQTRNKNGNCANWSAGNLQLTGESRKDRWENLDIYAAMQPLLLKDIGYTL